MLSQYKLWRQLWRSDMYTTDALGHPVSVQRIGQMDFAKVLSTFPPADAMANIARDIDLQNRVLGPLSRRLGRRIYKTVTILDMAGGTGDIAFRMAQHGASVTVSDINQDMLDVGIERAMERGIDGLVWSRQNAEELSFSSRIFDAYTIAFGMRNVTDIPAALAEARRVLRPGGQFLCLEFSRVVLPVLDDIYDRYSFSVLPWLGKRVARDEAAYRYLAESIRRFPDQAAYGGLIRAAGLESVRIRNLSGGIAAIHSARRV